MLSSFLNLLTQAIFISISFLNSFNSAGLVGSSSASSDFQNLGSGMLEQDAIIKARIKYLFFDIIILS